MVAQSQSALSSSFRSCIVLCAKHTSSSSQMYLHAHTSKHTHTQPQRRLSVHACVCVCAVRIFQLEKVHTPRFRTSYPASRQSPIYHPEKPQAKRKRISRGASTFHHICSGFPVIKIGQSNTDFNYDRHPFVWTYLAEYRLPQSRCRIFEINIP